MRTRYLARPIQELAFEPAHRIALISGPRQCGKTTLSKMLLKKRGAGAYQSWDDVVFRRAWSKDPKSVVPPSHNRETPLLVLDELHKDRRWKGALKGLYDTLTHPCDILVTGSARLNVHLKAKGSDSLLGRYLNFRLHPFTLREMSRPDILGPDQFMEALFSRSTVKPESHQDNLDSLMAFGPFPEPLFAQDRRRANIWRRNREMVVVREELRDLSKIAELGRVEMLTSLLPARVGSRFSASAVREDLEVSFDTVKRWMALLCEIYYLFEIKPWSRRVPRTLKREGKVYLWDYSGVPDTAARFENLVAAHLLKACHYWTDTGEGDFDLYYLRTKEGHEIDFLIVRDGEPWLPVEVKYSDRNPSPHWRKFLALLPCRRALQLVYRPAWRVHDYPTCQLLVAGSAEVIGVLV
jgi:predicted AAA+ superfamily ATPase